MPLPILQSDTGITPYWPLASGWQNRVYQITSNQNDFTNDITMKADLKLYGPMEVGIWAGWDLYTSPAAILSSYRPHLGLRPEVSLVGYVDDASYPTGGYWIIRTVGARAKA